MAVTIKVNGSNLSLAHKASQGIVKSTLPDVCKTPAPGGPIPIPYPVIISLTSDLKKGTKSVAVDGGNPAATKVSELSRCTGDEPGTAKGIKSSTQMKEATWLSWSMDVFMEGSNVCRLGDKLLMNHGNTACLGGILQPSVTVGHEDVILELQILCDLMCELAGTEGAKQMQIAYALWAMDRAMNCQSTLKAEVPFDPTDVSPYMSQNDPCRATRNWFIPGHRRPDVVITDGGPPILANIRAVVEMKFDDGSTGFSQTQIQAYRAMFGDRLIVMEEGVDCICEEDDDEQQPDPVPVPVPVPVPESENQTDNAPTDLTPQPVPVPVPAPVPPIPQPTQPPVTAPQGGGGGGIDWGAAAAGVGLGLVAIGLLFVPFDGPVGEAAAASASFSSFALAFGG